MPKVQSAEQKTSKNNKTYYVVTLEDGTKATCWQPVDIGTEGTIQLNGDFKNFIPVVTQSPNVQIDDRDDSIKDQLDRIEKRVMKLTEAVQTYTGVKDVITPLKPAEPETKYTYDDEDLDQDSKDFTSELPF